MILKKDVGCYSMIQPHSSFNLLGFKVCRIVAEIAEKSLHLNVHHFLMFREILHENPTGWTLLSHFTIGALPSSSCVVGFFRIFLQSHWFFCAVGV